MYFEFHSLCLSFYSIAAAVFWSAVFIVLLSFFRKRMKELRYVSIYSLFLLLLLCVLRAVIPLEMPYTYIINSYKILPWIQSFSSMQLLWSGSFTVTPLFLILLVWFFGAAVILFHRIRSSVRFRRFLNQIPAAADKNLYRILEEADTENKMKNVKIIIHASAVSPAVFGCFRPVIILPDIHFDNDGLYSIFLHECAHFKYYHALIKLAAEIVSICFWWNPFFKVLRAETVHALEMHADRDVCRQLDKKQQLAYLASILKVFQTADSADMPQIFGCGLAEKRDSINLSQRFQMILKEQYKKKAGHQWLIALLAVFVFFISYAVIPQPYSVPTTEDIGYAEYDSCSNYFLVETDNGYDLYEYPDCFIYHLKEMQESLQCIEIYKSMDEVLKNE